VPRLFAALLIPCAALAFADDPADKIAFEAVCGKCHPPTMVSDLRTEPDWKETIETMKNIGANGTDEQFTRLFRYLARNLTKVNINTGTAAEIAPVLDVSDAVAQTVVRYRTDHGNFKTLDDVKKVPGLSAASLAERKERIAF